MARKCFFFTEHTVQEKKVGDLKNAETCIRGRDEWYALDMNAAARDGTR